MKINTKPLPGMMELLPEEQIEFDRILNIIKKHHSKFGYVPIDTPIIERTEILLAKAGGETEKQVYRFNKGDNDLSLRFDLTVPTARFIADNFGQLSFPFKRSQIGKVYRGERSQRGRFREFYQCDIDVVGRDKLSINYDAEIISVIYAIFKELNFGDFTLRISNRKIISGLIEGLGLQEKSNELLALIDRSEKISIEEFNRSLEDLLDKPIDRQIINNFIQVSGDTSKSINDLRNLSKEINSTLFNEGVAELESVTDLLRLMNVCENSFVIDMRIVRGLDYYTGTIFETFLNDYRTIGSVSSGGRYDNLSEFYSREKFPGVGASIGLTRLFWVMRELGLLNFSQKTTANFMIIPFSKSQVAKSLEIANNLRNKNYSVEVLLEEFNLKKSLKLADKRGVQYTIVVGDDEIAKNEYFFKDMKTGERLPLSKVL